MSDQKKTPLPPIVSDTEDVFVIPDGPIIESELTLRDARSLIFHLLYAIEAFDYSVSLESVIDNFHRGLDITLDQHGDIVQKTAAIVNDRQELDTELVPLLAKWKLERLGVVTRLILRIALWELHHTDLSPSIVINEAIELAKCFGEEDSYKFINGVLDEWMKRNKPELVEEVSSETAE